MLGNNTVKEQRVLSLNLLYRVCLMTAQTST